VFGVRAEHHPLRLQLLTQDAVVLDDAVLHHRHPAGAVEVRVGVALLRLAVGGPAGVADAAQTGSPVGFKALREVHQLALGAQAAQPSRSIPLSGLHRGDAGGVVAAIFELPQPFQQQRRRFSRADHRNDAAHKKTRRSRA